MLLVIIEEKWPVLARHERAAERLRVWTDLGRAARTIDAYARGLVEFLEVCEGAGDRFWAALDRLAQRQGHDGHRRYLLAAAEPTNRYEFRCVSCERTIATMDVQREAGLTGRY
jgi:hypothetical protein